MKWWDEVTPEDVENLIGFCFSTVKDQWDKEREMELYKNEDLCIECKNEFFSKPYDHRDPTPGQLGYCIKCDNFLIKDREMEFDKSRVYTALNADELKAGDKVITARCMADLKIWVEADAKPNIIELIQDETNTDRFTCKHYGSNKTYDSPLAYLVERAENCTNCGSHEVCGYVQNVSKFACLNRCENYNPKTEQKAEKHYRPFRDTDELIKVWNKKFYLDFKPSHDPLTMPCIWARRKEGNLKGQLITEFSNSLWVEMGKEGYNMTDLLVHFTFLDGTPCGVEE